MQGRALLLSLLSLYRLLIRPKSPDPSLLNSAPIFAHIRIPRMYIYCRHKGIFFRLKSLFLFFIHWKLTFIQYYFKSDIICQICKYVNISLHHFYISSNNIFFSMNVRVGKLKCRLRLFLSLDMLSKYLCLFIFSQHSVRQCECGSDYPCFPADATLFTRHLHYDVLIDSYIFILHIVRYICV